MQRIISKLLFVLFPCALSAQIITYNISFPNAVHHEADIAVSFSDIETDTLLVQMSSASPGRYAIHNFAKNVFNFKAVNESGDLLNVFRLNPSLWGITGHSNTVKVSYSLFANRGDGTYSQIDETHAHLNMPATFVFAPDLSSRPIEINFEPRTDLNWSIATQLPLLDGTTYSAPNLQYFMDSPTEISNFGLRSFKLTSNDKEYKIRLALHHNGTEEELDTYFESVKKVVLEQQKVFDELPDFDYGTYTFLGCYMPNVSGDGMEHRNSTVLTSTRSLANGGLVSNIGTVSHEFFHAWNVERIRPKSLEPFDFTKANMSGALWFAEGFTNYYQDLILCRAGLRSPQQYVAGLAGTFNYVWNSPARQFFSPIEMSYQAPFVDAATALDPVNRENTFISYYSYGSVLGLALDLALRSKGLNLDDYMKMLWNSYGKTEKPYTIENLRESLRQYAGRAFADTFFDTYIYKSKMPDFTTLFKHVGVQLGPQTTAPYFGANVKVVREGRAIIQTNPLKGSPAYIAGLVKGDIIVSVNGVAVPGSTSFKQLLKTFAIEDRLEIGFKRYGIINIASVVLTADPTYRIALIEQSGVNPGQEVLDNRAAWLKVE